MKYIKLFEDVFSEEDCANLIAKFEKSEPELDIVEDHRYFKVLDTRKCVLFDDVYDDMTSRFISVIRQYCKECDIKTYQWSEEIKFEDFRMKKYEAGYGRFSPHVDVNSVHDNQRFLVFFLYLNDVEEGGETTFIDTKQSIKPKRGSVLVFPPTWTYPHAGEIPVSNDKYIIGGYLHYGEQ